MPTRPEGAFALALLIIGLKILSKKFALAAAAGLRLAAVFRAPPDHLELLRWVKNLPLAEMLPKSLSLVCRGGRGKAAAAAWFSSTLD